MEMASDGNTPEKYEAFKAEIIKALNDLKFEDDPHIVFVSAKNHDPHINVACGCRGFLMETGVNLIESATGAKVSDMIGIGSGPFSPSLRKGPIMGKGGEA